MTPSREALGARLRPLLSLTEGRGCVELLTLAGLPSGRGYAQTAAVALNELVAKGLARREKPYGHGPQFFAVPAPVVGDEERVGLPELDAILVFKTTIGRPFGAPSDRTTVTCTALLGPSWPAGTRVPPWSTGLFASQVAAGGLGAAKANGTARLRAALSALRADPTPPPPSPPEVPVSTPDQIQKFLEFTASVKNGARRDTCLSWLKARGLSRVKSEELIETLLETGAIVPQDFVVAGETITRYLPPSGSVEPAPLPKSDAPPEEPAATIAEVREELRQEGIVIDAADLVEEPVAVAGAAEPCQECEASVHELARVRTWLESAREERDSARIERDRLREQLDTAQAQASAEPCVACATMQGQLAEARAHMTEWRTRHDRLADQHGILTTERDDLALQRDRVQDTRCTLAVTVGLGGGAGWHDVIERVKAIVAQASAGRPVVDPGAIAHYLLELPEERWEALATARGQLAQGRRLAEHGARLQAEARAAVDRLLDTPAGAQAPAPELVPDPIPLGEPIPAPPPSGEQPSAPREPDRSSVIGRALAWLRRREQGTPGELAAALKIAMPHAGSTLVTLTNRGFAERVAQGVYRAREQGREAAE